MSVVDHRLSVTVVNTVPTEDDRRTTETDTTALIKQPQLSARSSRNNSRQRSRLLARGGPPWRTAGLTFASCDAPRHFRGRKDLPCCGLQASTAGYLPFTYLESIRTVSRTARKCTSRSMLLRPRTLRFLAIIIASLFASPNTVRKWPARILESS